MNGFEIYFKLGLQHILDFAAIDHLAFIVALIAGMTLRNIKNILWLLTAFTIGHAITLGLTALELIPHDRRWIEFLIAVSICMMVMIKLFQKSESGNWFSYLLIGSFGLIHGMGFSSYFHALLGKETSLLLPLLGFNVGVEIAQWLVALIVLLISAFLIYLDVLKAISMKYFLLGISFGLGLYLSLERWPI